MGRVEGSTFVDETCSGLPYEEAVVDGAHASSGVMHLCIAYSSGSRARNQFYFLKDEC